MTRAAGILALSGGVGGAKLAVGLRDVLPAGSLTVVANTGDDFEYLGLHVSPDVDSLIYALAGVNNPDTGWGRDGESWTFMTELERLGVDAWFRLGDRDLAVHACRTGRLRAGQTLSAVTRELCARFRTGAAVVPMSDDAVRTVVRTDAGPLPFQEYFVRRRCAPAVTGVSFDDTGRAAASPEFLAALADPALGGIVICPSNPWLSIDPILSLPGVREAISASSAPVVAVSPIVGGRAIKGPTAKIMAELGLSVSAGSVAAHYGQALDAFVLDASDGSEAAAIAAGGVAVEAARTVMRTPDDRRELARRVLTFLERLRAGDGDLR